MKRRNFIRNLTLGLLGLPVVAKLATAKTTPPVLMPVIKNFEPWYPVHGVNVYVLLDARGKLAVVKRVGKLPPRPLFHCYGLKNMTTGEIIKWRTYEDWDKLERITSIEGIPEADILMSGTSYPFVIGYRAENGFSVG